jgi:hypothetical protein
MITVAGGREVVVASARSHDEGTPASRCAAVNGAI